MRRYHFLSSKPQILAVHTAKGRLCRALLEGEVVVGHLTTHLTRNPYAQPASLASWDGRPASKANKGDDLHASSLRLDAYANVLMCQLMN